MHRNINTKQSRIYWRRLIFGPCLRRELELSSPSRVFLFTLLLRDPSRHPIRCHFLWTILFPLFFLASAIRRMGSINFLGGGVLAPVGVELPFFHLGFLVSEILKFL